MGTMYRLKAVALLAILVLTLGWVAACTPEAQREADRELDEAGNELGRATERAGEELEEAGAAMERGLERANERMEPYMADAEVTARVKTKLTADPEVNSFRIDVDTIDGKVTLSGLVASERQREEAQRLAEGTQGVVEVINNLEVGERGE